MSLSFVATDPPVPIKRSSLILFHASVESNQLYKKKGCHARVDSPYGLWIIEDMKKKEISVSAPGRICLFGEHQDYFGLPIIAAAINLRIFIRGTRRDDHQVIINLPDLGEEEEFSLKGDLAYRKERDYLRSAINVLRRKGIRFEFGWDCSLQGSIPINAGQRMAFYVTRTSGTMYYTNGSTEGTVYVSNSHLEIYEGKGGGYFASLNTPRVWNGTITYCP